MELAACGPGQLFGLPILHGLLNDPDEEIREGAKDAIEMLQTPPVTLK